MTPTSGRLDKVLAAATIAGQPTGAVLRLERLALRVEQTALAKQMGFSRQRLDLYERDQAPISPLFIKRYRAALTLIVRIAPDDSACPVGAS